MQQSVNVTTIQQQPVQDVQVSNGRQYNNYSSHSSICLGALQIVIGILSCMFNTVALIFSASHSSVAHGFWCGLFFIMAGVFGILAGHKKRGGLIVTFMVLSIISAILCVFLMSISSAAVNKDRDQQCFFGFCFYSYTVSQEVRETRVAMNGLLVVLSLIEIIIAIWSSVICCSAVCCGNTGDGGRIQTQHTVHYVNQPNQQVLFISPAGQVMGQQMGQPIGPGVQYYTQPAYNTGQPQIVYPATTAPPAYEYPQMSAAASSGPMPNAPPVSAKQAF